MALLAFPIFSQAAEPSWFNHGFFSVEVGASSATLVSAQSCQACHSEIYRDWTRSRHAHAWTNQMFQEGLVVDRADRCFFCHTPLKEQFRQAKGLSADTGLAKEGVSCAACHVRDGQIWSAADSPSAPHSVKSATFLRDAQFCAGCHQFNFSKQLRGELRTQNLASQNTFIEWQSYVRKGGKRTCQECHMPGGRHIFLGPHNAEFLKSSVTVKVRKAEGGYLFFIRPNEVGHRVPTGDVFRNITLEVRSPEDPAYRVVATFGRVYARVTDPNTGNTIQRPVSDTTLAPFEDRTIRVALKKGGHYRLRYHFTNDFFERRSRLPEDLLTVVIAEGTAD